MIFRVTSQADVKRVRRSTLIVWSDLFLSVSFHQTPKMTSTIDDLLEFVNKVYDVSADFNQEEIGLSNEVGVAQANDYAAKWIRWEKYGSFKYNVLLGVPEMAFIDQANLSGITRVNEFQDPTFNIPVGVPHLLYTLEGVLLNGGTPTIFNANTGDIAGWGGDFINFYGDWWNASANTDRTGQFAGDVWAAANLASDGSKYDFHIRDWVEDMDGFNIATILVENPGMTLPTAMQQYYQPTGKSGYKTRFQSFYKNRFGGNQLDTIDAAYAVLNFTNNAEVVTFREGLLIQRVGFKRWADIRSDPSWMDIRIFCRGLSTKMQSMIAAEKALP
jgi:hypothetical protein